MNEELKEVFAKLENLVDYKKYNEFSDKEAHIILSYINNLEDKIKFLQQKAEQGEHYKHLYSLVKKEKDEVVIFAKKEKENYLTKACRIADTNNAGLITSAAIYTCDEILRMLGEIDE